MALVRQSVASDQRYRRFFMFGVQYANNGFAHLCLAHRLDQIGSDSQFLAARRIAPLTTEVSIMIVGVENSTRSFK